jgi:hypothetical protein
VARIPGHSNVSISSGHIYPSERPAATYDGSAWSPWVSQARSGSERCLVFSSGQILASRQSALPSKSSDHYHRVHLCNRIMAGLALQAGFQVFAMVPLHAGQDAKNADPGNGLLLLGKFCKLHNEKLVFGNGVVASPLLAPRHTNWRKNWPVRTVISFICTTRWSPTTTIALSRMTVIHRRCAAGNLKSSEEECGGYGGDRVVPRLR